MKEFTFFLSLANVDVHIFKQHFNNEEIVNSKDVWEVMSLRKFNNETQKGSYEEVCWQNLDNLFNL